MSNQVPSVTTLALMERYMDGAVRRQVLRMENLAQLDTPGYKAKDIPFEKYMEELVATAEQEGSSSAERVQKSTEIPVPEPVGGLAVRPDQNNVDLDQELRMISGNVSKFNVVAQVMQQKLKTLRTSINDQRS